MDAIKPEVFRAAITEGRVFQFSLALPPELRDREHLLESVRLVRKEALSRVKYPGKVVPRERSQEIMIASIRAEGRWVQAERTVLTEVVRVFSGRDLWMLPNRQFITRNEFGEAMDWLLDEYLRAAFKELRLQADKDDKGQARPEEEKLTRIIKFTA